MTDQKFTKFSSSKFLHIYRVSHAYQTKLLEDISQACAQYSNNLQLGYLLITMACGLYEFPVSRSPSKPPSIPQILHILYRVYISMSIPKDYPIQIGTHGSLESLNLYKTCKLSLPTIKLPDIVASYAIAICTPKLNCMGHTPYSNSPNFISPKVVQQTIRKFSYHQSFPPYGIFNIRNLFYNKNKLITVQYGILHLTVLYMSKALIYATMLAIKWVQLHV